MTDTKKCGCTHGRQCVLFMCHIVSDETLRRFSGIQKAAASMGFDAVWVVDATNRDILSVFPGSIRPYPVTLDLLDAFTGVRYHSIMHRGENPMWHNCTSVGLLPFAVSHSEYDYIWLVEGDVCYSGDWGHLFSAFLSDSSDMISSSLMSYEQDAGWTWWNDVGHAQCSRLGLWHSLNPLIRISRYALESVLQFCKRHNQYNAMHPEIIFASAVKRAGLSYTGLEPHHGNWFFGKINQLSEDIRPNRLYHGISTSVNWDELILGASLI